MPLLLRGSNNPNSPNLGRATAPKVEENPDPSTEFDEYGTELHREARVWKVYVKETDRHDGDLVKTWNDSADVILVFAALFSAISSAFLIESSKMLQEDPLLVISQTLLSIANGTQPPGSSSPPSGDSTEFTPSRTAVWVNTLWYLSLSLSLATAFIAILAKDWCRSFMSNRTGHPFDQTYRRQKKWDMLVSWKMPELLAFLPSLIHVALLLFAIGLCITLWDTHIVVAVPVICVSGISFGFYVSSSIAGSLVDYFPYPTIISRIYRTKFRKLMWQILVELSLALCFVLGWAAALVPYIVFVVITIPVAILYCALKKWQDCISVRGQQLHQRILIPFLSSMLYITERLSLLFLWIAEGSFEAVVEDILLPWFERQTPMIQRKLTKFAFARHKAGTRRDNACEKDDAQVKDNVTGQALSWLIVHCEVPQSVDIALQSIAGATNRISRQPLLDCQAPLEILRRLASSSLYRSLATKSEVAVSLYLRAISFLGAPPDPDSDEVKYSGGELEASIWDLQMETEKKIAALIEDGSFEPTRDNLDAFRIGSTMALVSLKMLKTELGGAEIKTIFDSIIRLLKAHLDRTNVLHKTALLSLAQAATLFLLFVPASITTRQPDIDLDPPSTPVVIVGNFPGLSGESAAKCDFIDTHTLVLLFLRLTSDQSSFGCIKGLASTCATLYNMLSNRAQTSRLDGLGFKEAVVRRLIEQYSQDEQTLELSYSFQLTSTYRCALQSTYESKSDIPLLGGNLWPDLRIADSITGQTMWPRLERRATRELKKGVISLESGALDAIYFLAPYTKFDPETYLLVVEVMCRTQSSSTRLWTRGAQMLSKHPFPILSEQLVAALEQRDLVSLLQSSSTSDDETKQYFVMGQLWLLLSLYIYPRDTTDGRDKLKVQLDKCKVNDYGSEDRHETLSRLLWIAFVPRSRSIIGRRLGIWAYRIGECVAQFRGESYNHYNNPLRDVPPEFRGLSSFITWPQRAKNPSTNEPQGVEATPVASALTVDVVENGIWKADGAGHADSRGDLEASAQVPMGGAGKSSRVRNEENVRLHAAGSERRLTGAGGVEATVASQSVGGETGNGNPAQGESNEGDVIIHMERLEERSS